MSNTPRLICLVGNPQAGKTLVQEILQRDYGVIPVDDGHPLRDFAMRHFGLSQDDCYTQAGKKRTTEICGVEWENRKILGELGAALEKTFGDFIMPWMATRALCGNQTYSFGSVRRDQPLFYDDKGAVIIEIQNPSARPTGNEWDEYNDSCVDYVIENAALHRGMSHKDALADLTSKVRLICEEIGLERLSEEVA